MSSWPTSISYPIGSRFLDVLIAALCTDGNQRILGFPKACRHCVSIDSYLHATSMPRRFLAPQHAAGVVIESMAALVTQIFFIAFGYECPTKVVKPN